MLLIFGDCCKNSCLREYFIQQRVGTPPQLFCKSDLNLVFWEATAQKYFLSMQHNALSDRKSIFSSVSDERFLNGTTPRCFNSVLCLCFFLPFLVLVVFQLRRWREMNFDAIFCFHSRIVLVRNVLGQLSVLYHWPNRKVSSKSYFKAFKTI